MSRKLIFLTLGILFLFALAALATETRVATMGNSGMYLKDDAGIFLYPGTMTMYKKMIIAEHFTNSVSSASVGPFSYGLNQRVGIIFPAWGTSTLAVFAGNGTESFSTAGGTTITQPTTRFLVGYGVNTGNSSLGFQVDFSGVRTETQPFLADSGQNTPVQIYTASTWGIGVGLSTPLGDLNNLDLGFRIRIGNFSYKDETPTGDTVQAKSDGNTTLSFVVRDYYALNDYVNLVPAGKFGVATQKDVDAPAQFKHTTTQIEAGLGVQTKPTENSEIIGGAGYRSSKTRSRDFAFSGSDSLDTETSTTSLPFAFLGFETQVKGWMHFRLGMEKDISSTKNKVNGPFGLNTTDDSKNERKQSTSPMRYAVGAGIHAGSVTMDALVENQWLNNGPNFLSGESTSSGQLFPRISLTYNFK